MRVPLSISGRGERVVAVDVVCVPQGKGWRVSKPTLVEVIKAALMANHVEDKPEIARTHMLNFGTAIDMFRLFNKRLPTSLQELTETPDGVSDPFLEEIPVDPWGNSYQLVVTGNQFRMRSFGPDGTHGGGDDVISPRPDK